MGHTHDHPHDHDHDHSSNVNIDKDIIKQWLASKRSTLWSVWAIADDEGRDKASEWLYKEIESLIMFATSVPTKEPV